MENNIILTLKVDDTLSDTASFDTSRNVLIFEDSYSGKTLRLVYRKLH